MNDLSWADTPRSLVLLRAPHSVVILLLGSQTVSRVDLLRLLGHTIGKLAPLVPCHFVEHLARFDLHGVPVGRDRILGLSVGLLEHLR